MEVDDVATGGLSPKEQKNKSDQMWETLTTTFAENVRNRSSHLEQILCMIKDNLTYDDPGLFPSYLIHQDDEREQVKAHNFWLLNQLIQISAMPDYFNIKKSNTDLQQTILAASYLKQLWFFYEAGSKYLEMLEQLNQIGPADSEVNVQLKTFHMPDSVFRRIECSCVIEPIVVPDVPTKIKLIENSLHILSQLVSLEDEQANRPFRERCASSVLNTLTHGSLNEKSLCLLFFVKYFKKVAEFTPDLERLVLEVLIVVDVTLERSDRWLRSEIIKPKALEKFKSTLMSFYARVNGISFNNSCTENRKKMVSCSIRIVKTLLTTKKDTGGSILDLLEQIKRFLRILLNHDESLAVEDELSDVLQIARKFPELLNILEVPITNELIASDDSNETDVRQLSHIWKNVYEISEDQKLTDSQKVVIKQKTIRIAFNVNHNISLWMQKQIPTPANKLSFFGGCLADLLQQLFENVQKSPVSIEAVLAVLDICFDVAYLNDFSALEGNLQKRICEWYLVPFKNYLCSSEFTLSEELSKVFNEISKEDQNIAILKTQSLTQTCTLSCENIPEAIAFNFKNALWKIIAGIVSSEDGDLKRVLHSSYRNLLLSSKYPANQIAQQILFPALYCPDLSVYAAGNLGVHFCLNDGNYQLNQVKDNITPIKRKIRCFICKPAATDRGCEIVSTQSTTVSGRCELFAQNDGLAARYSVTTEFDLPEADIARLFASKDPESQRMIASLLPVLFKHKGAVLCENEDLVQAWSDLIMCPTIEVSMSFTKTLQVIMESLKESPLATKQKEKIIQTCLEKLLKAVQQCLQKSDYSYQSAVLQMVVSFATGQGMTEERLLVCIRMMLFFLMSRESELTREAALAVGDMCGQHGVSPRDMLNWYRHDIVKLMVAIGAVNYILHELPLHKSLFHRPACENLLQEIANMIRKDKIVVLSASFLTIYPYLFMNESTAITNQCIDYIMTHTGNTLVHLLHSDIKKTVSEILIFYHVNPECVLHAFCSLLAKDDSQEITTSQMAEYISNRFLGVLTSFEALLINPETEKTLKRETILSLGEIIRLLGGHLIAPFRFKIIALLKTTLAIEELNLKDACIKVWRIFICTVDVQQLGPLLGTIFVSLEQFIDQYPEDINFIFEYLVVQNNALLSQYIKDLFFLEETKVDRQIKKIVSAQTKSVRSREQFLERFNALITHINHENLSVRVYGLKYLKELFSYHREQLNEALIGHSILPEVPNLLNNLMKSCSDIDTNYRLRSAECIGELGALAPSYLPPKYAPQERFALNIHSDSFAIMALAELCRAYQFKKETKFVDNFSLAIQEILNDQGVSPKTGKKIEVWEAIPERLRPIMEPLLTSSYTGLIRTAAVECHPIFGSVKGQTCHEWSYLWASQLIEKLDKKDSQNLLGSFRPSIRCDFSTMTMFLPYILLHALQGSSEDKRKKITEELQYVFDAVMNNNNPEAQSDNPEQQDYYVRSVRTMQFVAKERKAQEEDVASDMSFECAKLAFRLLDFLEKWKRQWRKVHTLNDASKSDYINVDNFLKQFNHELMANINYTCKEYARSLMYLETFIEENPSQLQNHLSMLAHIFTHLNDPDSVEGVMCLKTAEPTLPEQILLHNATGRLHQTAACYERMLQVGEVKPTDIHNIVEVYLRLDQPKTALLLSESLLNQFSESNVDAMLQEIKAEPLYKLGRFEELEELLESPQIQQSDSWGVICGSMLVSYRKNDHALFVEKLEQARLAVLRILHSSDLSISAYEKGYEQVLKLHMIAEFEKCEQLVDNMRSNGLTRCVTEIKQLIENFEARLQLLQPNAATVEPIISLRRILLNETKSLLNGFAPDISKKEINETIDNHIGELWMKSTELASRAKLYEQAHLYILHAESYKPKGLFIKKAKLLWEKRDTANVFNILHRGLAEILEKSNLTDPKLLPKEDRLIYAEGKLLIAIYNADASNVSASVNTRCFKDAVQAHQECEVSLVHMAQYLDKLYANFSSDDQDSPKGWELLQDVLTYYGKSMMHGSTCIYQSMPRMLSVWFDFSSKTVNNDNFKKYSSNINKLALRFSENLSPYFFFTAFSQLISRVAHPSVEVYHVLKSIIIKLILNYPQQSLWMLLSVYKSSYANRVKRCHEIFNDKQLAKTSIQKMISDFNALAERFIELTNKDIKTPRDVAVTVSSLVKTLPKLFSDEKLSKIMMPIQKCMQLVLDKSSATFAPYPMNEVYIHGIREEVTVMQSLQKPRRITLIGSDGRDYMMMMKPKDDLRKDFRLMEFNAVVKQYLHQDPEAKHRRLKIRTYAVLPLNEECGIIEWVENVSTLRSIIYTYYKQRGVGMHARELREYNFKRQDSLQKKREAFDNVLLARHPPVFGEWFRDRFSNPHNWFQARSSYIRTTAVISIVGYILGLGDRHGENIMLDATNGDTVHVDFNCLFNKGETFEIPEMVPFRLTHNMVKAMGPLGAEGLFRKCCEITLRVLQNQTPTLMSVLKPFVYDPLVSWSKITKHDGTTERTDPQAMNNVKHIEERLKGYVRTHGKICHLPISIEGQVNHLISEATNKDNLAQMFIGWTAYM
ncbi:esr1 protein [Culex quinquefasciatus]|uniref:Serine/threonine-protein kinase ATR n=1 Tax=Culex quinquefasciatus TaxID=7176 RepID=B0W656_CULQU|nr:esr1 protein [Culex quinquefasciatus]|eukprot:XP_001844190.1 esr1 protein [Culex quinquefasciatus]